MYLHSAYTLEIASKGYVMLLSRFALPITVAAVVFGFSQMQFTVLAQENNAEQGLQRKVVEDAPPPACPVTLPLQAGFEPQSSVLATRVGIGAEGKVARYGTNKLWTVLPTDGTWRGEIPRKTGDFAYSNKLPWGGAFSDSVSPLTITGKRIDGPAPTFTEVEEISGFPNGEEHTSIMGGISIPVFGCWKITGHYKDQELSFTMWVTPRLKSESTSSDSSQPVAEDMSALQTKPRRIHVDGDVEAKQLVYRVIPEAPHEAEVVNVSGAVVLHAVIGEDGRAHELQYVSGPPLLLQAAINAATWWQYRITAESIEVDTTIDVVFSPANN
jgi:hypothetical protein